MNWVKIAVLIITLTPYANATSGRTNASGCHNSKKVGYHCHGVKRQTTSASSYRSTDIKPNTTQKTTNKTTNDEQAKSLAILIIIQNYLKKLGYYKGEITGKSNAATTKAIKSFQKENSLPENGVPTRELMLLLVNKFENKD